MIKENININECCNPCILVLQDGSKHGKVICGMSNYKNMKRYAEYQLQLTEQIKGIFKSDTAYPITQPDGTTEMQYKIYKVIFNNH